MGRAARIKWARRQRPVLLDRPRVGDVHQRISQEAADYAAMRAAIGANSGARSAPLERQRFPTLEDLVRTAGSCVFMPPQPFMYQGRRYWGRVRGPVELEVFAAPDDPSPIAVAVASDESLADWIRRG